MIYEDVIKKICSRMGDKLFNRYRDVAGGYFISAIVDTIAGGKGYTLEEISPLVEDEKRNLSGNFLDLTEIDNLFQVLSISRTNYIMKEITEAEYQRGFTEEIFEPSGNEVFWYRKGNMVYFVGVEDSIAIVQITYITMPTEPEYSHDLEYGIGFIHRMINLAVMKLKVDLGTMKLPEAPEQKEEA